MLTPVKLNVFFKLFLMYLTYDSGISFGYEQKIIKRGGKTFNFKGINIVINLKKTLNPFTNQ